MISVPGVEQISRRVSIAKLPSEKSDSGWFAVLDSVPKAVTLRETQRFDWVIVGGGWMGLHATQRLAELRPDDRVALVDAGRIGNNAAGRCAGFAIDLAHNPRKREFAEDVDGNREEAKINRGGIAYMHDIIKRYSIQCDWSPEGKIHAAASESGKMCLRNFAHALDNIGESYSWLDSRQMQDIVGTEHFVQGIHTPGAVLLQPAAYLRGLAGAVPDNVSVYENTAVENVIYERPRHRLETCHGAMDSENVILANNGFITYFGFYAGTAIPVYTFGSLTRPLDKSELHALGGRETWGIIAADSFGSTMRKTADHRLFIRNIFDYARDFEVSPSRIESAQRRHQRTFETRYPDLAHIGFEHSWGGGLCLAQNGGMVFGRLSDGVYGVAFCNGTGVARGAAFGKAIAELACRHNNDTITALQRRAKPSRPYPRFITETGVRLMTRYRLWQAGREV